MYTEMKVEQIISLLEDHKYKELRSSLEAMNEVDIAVCFEELKDKELAIAFRLIHKDLAAEVFANMNEQQQGHLVSIFSEQELRELLEDLYVDDTVDMLEDLPANLVTRVLEYVPPSKREILNQILKYPDDSAGSLMTTEYVSLRLHMTVQEAMTRIKRQGIHSETIYTLYVTNRRKLIGIVSAKDLMIADDDVAIKDLMETEHEIISVTTHTDKEHVAELFSKYDLLALPVLDVDGFLVGIVTVDDAMDVIIEEATEDIERMAAINPSEKAYFETSVLEHAKNRVPWLLVLMLAATITGGIIARFEHALATMVVLATFLPMLMNTGGNGGSQSSALIIRGLALGEVEFRDFFRVWFKEIRVALLVGIVLAIANGIRIAIMNHDVKLAIVVGLSLFCTLLLSKSIGCMLPLIAKKIGMDPALMSAPFITTIVDACSVLIFFSIASAMFGL